MDGWYRVSEMRLCTLLREERYMEYIVSLDLSLSNTGVAIFDYEGNCKKLLSIDTNKGDNHSLRLKRIEKALKKIKKEYKPNLVLIEETHPQFANSARIIAMVRGVAILVFYNVEQITYQPTMIRKEVLGKGNAKKEELQNFILENYKDIKFDDLDQSDAFGLGLCYFKKKGII